MSNREINSVYTAGFSLIELMVSITIGAVLLLGLATLLSSTSINRNEMEKSGRQIENGRYAIQVLSDDIRHAGFYGDLGDTSVMVAPATFPAPCSTTLSEMRSALFMYIQGYDNATSLPTGCSVANTNFKSGTDILVIRRASTSLTASLVANEVYLQTNSAEFKLDTTNFTLKNKSGGTAGIRKYVLDIYFVSTCSICTPASDNIPTLKRLELYELDSVLTFVLTPLVEGVENLQVEYGIDSDGDGTPNSYTIAPATMANWSNAVTARIYVLARNNEKSPNWNDSAKTYDLGLSGTYTPVSNDSFKRHLYSEVIRLNNPGGRRES